MMDTRILWRAAAVVTFALLLGSNGVAQGPEQMRLRGAINDFTAALDAGGPWQIAGDWSVTVRGESGKADFHAALTMVRAEDAGSRSPHTHHVTVLGGHVTSLANGLRISGTAALTSNGNLAGFTGSPVEITVTGGNALPYSNVAVTFGGAAVPHFGDLPIEGVVTDQR